MGGGEVKKLPLALTFADFLRQSTIIAGCLLSFRLWLLD